MWAAVACSRARRDAFGASCDAELGQWAADLAVSTLVARVGAGLAGRRQAVLRIRAAVLALVVLAAISGRWRAFLLVKHPGFVIALRRWIATVNCFVKRFDALCAAEILVPVWSHGIVALHLEFFLAVLKAAEGQSQQWPGEHCDRMRVAVQQLDGHDG